MHTILIYTLSLMLNCSIEWSNSIHNPENEEFVIETAFNLGILPQQVTQEQFDARYGDLEKESFTSSKC